MLKKMRKNMKRLLPVKFLLSSFFVANMGILLRTCGQSVN